MKIKYLVDKYEYNSFEGTQGSFDTVEEAIVLHKKLNSDLEYLDKLALNLGKPRTTCGTNYVIMVEYEEEKPDC